MAFGWMKPLFKGAADGLQRLRFNSWTLGGRGADVFEKGAEALELERMNPLRGVDEWRLGQIFDDARDGIYADLAWLYNEIEGVEPALVACCDMREGAAGECGWLVTTPDAERTRGFDQTLADEQRAALLAEFGPLGDDLADLAAHLVSAFFRGAAHALPLWNADGSLAGFRPLDLWNFALDRGTGRWWWNADASRDEGSFQPIPPGELVTLAVSSSRHVDHAALPIFIRSALGTKRYGVWLDRFGIPPVAVIMPPSAERGEQANYMDLARKFARGGNGILPSGSAVSYGTEARAVCPFPDFIRFQQEQIYTVGIGRVQSGANDSANLGGNAAGVVEAGFARLVRRDARRTARAINDTVTRKVLARLFPGRPALAQFAWDTEARRTSREVLEDAGLARNAGLAIDRAQLEEMTGYTLSEAPQAPDGGFGGAPFPQDRRNGIAKPLQNARTGSDGDLPPPAGETRQSARESISRLAEALGADMAPARDELLKLLDIPEAERPAAARELMDRLDELMPSDPAMAAVLAEEMAEAFAEGAGEETISVNGAADKAPAGGESETRKAGAEAAILNYGTSEGAKKGWETRRGHGWTQAQYEEGRKTVDSLVAELDKRGPDGVSKAWTNTPRSLGALNDEVAADIARANPLMRVSAGASQTVDADQLNHALREHGVGAEHRPNHVPITKDDLRNIPDILSDYDEIVPGLGKADGKKQEGVVFRKRYPDGTVSCVEIDFFNRKTSERELKFQTMWKEKQ